MICETPLHAGSGSDLGVIDLSIQREGHTNFPKIEGSSLKGALREHVAANCTDKALEKRLFDVFGPEENTDTDLYAGAIGFSDARLLLFPVKSMKGIFAWITCPKALLQLQRDFARADIQVELPKGLQKLEDHQAFVLKGNKLTFDEKIILEEYAFETLSRLKEISIQSKDIGQWMGDTLFANQNTGTAYWQEKLKQDIVIVSDDVFRDFTEFSTEVITRIRIDEETGVVKNGALWTEEYLPAESILYSLALIGKPRAKAKSSLKTEEEVQKFVLDNLKPIIQIGGNATVGKGITRLAFHSEKPQKLTK